MIPDPLSFCYQSRFETMSITLFSIQYHWCCLRWMSQPTLVQCTLAKHATRTISILFGGFQPYHQTLAYIKAKLQRRGFWCFTVEFNSLWVPQIPLHSSLLEIHIFSFPIPIPTPNHNNLFAISETLTNLQGYIWTEIQYALIQKLFLCMCVRFASTFPNSIYFEIRCG